eukprot:m.232199 g.232199  ORF g.232199 m.232199 type:complete len:342 (+) comp12313_c0_seq1:151-1176(+)
MIATTTNQGKKGKKTVTTNGNNRKKKKTEEVNESRSRSRALHDTRMAWRSNQVEDGLVQLVRRGAISGVRPQDPREHAVELVGVAGHRRRAVRAQRKPLGILVCGWGTQGCSLQQRHAQREHVGFCGKFAREAIEDLARHVLGVAGLKRAGAVGEANSLPEIADLEDGAGRRRLDEDVGRLDVGMHNLRGVDLAQADRHVLHDAPELRLGQGRHVLPMPSNDVCKGPTFAQLQEQKGVRVGETKAGALHHVRLVAQACHDVLLLQDMHLGCTKIGDVPREALESVRARVDFGVHLVHGPEGAAPDLGAEIKVILRVRGVLVLVLLLALEPFHKVERRSVSD